MSSLLFNMAAPPRSVVEYQNYQLTNKKEAKYILISPYYIMNSLKISFNNAANALEEIKENLKLDNAPKEYILSLAFDCLNYDDSIKKIEELKKFSKVVLLEDINLSLVIIGKISNDLYIPLRKLEYNQDKLSKIYFINYEDIYND